MSPTTPPAASRLFNVPEASWASRGGRFGAHASNENQPPMAANRIALFLVQRRVRRSTAIPHLCDRPLHSRPRIAPQLRQDQRRRALQGAIQTNTKVDDRGHLHRRPCRHGLHILGSAGKRARLRTSAQA
jgi:hypothetical protein